MHHLTLICLHEVYIHALKRSFKASIYLFYFFLCLSLDLVFFFWFLVMVYFSLKLISLNLIKLILLPKSNFLTKLELQCFIFNIA